MNEEVLGELEKRGIRKRKVLEYIYKYSPELAEEIATEEDPESIIAKELIEWKLYKLSKLQEIDLPTLMVSWSILRDMLRFVMDMVAQSTESFFTRYMAMEQYMLEKMPSPAEEKKQGLLSLLTLLVSNFVDKFDKMVTNVGGVGSVQIQPKEEKVKWTIDIGGKAKTNRSSRKRRKSH